MKKYILLLVLPILIFACSPRTGSVIYEEPEDLIIGVADSLYNLELFFVAATPDYLIFEAEFINYSSQDILLKREDFEIRIPEFAFKAQPYSTDDMMEFLLLERKKIKKAKRRQTVINGISLGASILGAGFGGWSTFDAVYYPLQDLLYLTDDRKFANRQVKTVEEEMDIIRELNLDSIIVAPADTIYKEIFFPFKIQTLDSIEIIYKDDKAKHTMVLDSRDLRN